MAEGSGPGGRQKHWIRWGGVAWVTLFLFWLPVEDVALWPAVTLAALGLAWMLLRWGSAVGPEGAMWPVAGALMGLMVPISAAALLVFKSGAHGHGFLELPLVTLFDVLPQVPYWGAAGLAVGLAIQFRVKQKPRKGD